ncbi:DUF4360 domain-containing protein [Streptomyces odontomachi]|uniref:DUF4360 domain-containing protein n=1 Tax=Streptomyces odontomachi TaxID=2944940 RepID=UPI00210C0A05|nr:DUF4360 domain-containing protein [Streptomyces sp. ODS25]
MSKYLLAGGTVAALVASTLGIAQAQAAETTVPSQRIEMSINTVNGSGCPAGTAAVAASADNTAFTVTYSDYLAQAGGGTSATESRKNCQLSLNVSVPQGFTYAIASADYRGYAYLGSGASLVQKASYYFMGSSETSSSTHQINGPLDDNWHTNDSTNYADLVWAPCGVTRNFNINTELRVSAGSSGETSFATMDSTDGSVSTTYQLSWMECPSAA